MNSKTRKLVVALALPACLIVAASAYAAQGHEGVRTADLNGVKGAVKSNGALRTHAVGHLQLKDHIVTCQKLAPALARTACKPAVKGKDGVDGKNGADGVNGKNGAAGDSYLKGAYYSVASYDVGDTNAGAIATVTCKNPTDTAISGGVQVLGLDEGANARNTPVSSSFPGRMDWNTNTPKIGRVDGWVVQFGGNANAQVPSDKDPQKTKLWALCVPGLDIPVVTTYTQSSN